MQLLEERALGGRLRELQASVTSLMRCREVVERRVKGRSESELADDSRVEGASSPDSEQRTEGGERTGESSKSIMTRSAAF